MSNRVDAAVRGDQGWLRNGKRGIENGDAGGGLGIQAGHFLVRNLVRNQRGGLAFTARPGSRRDGDEREHRFPGFVDAPVVQNPAAIGQNEVAALRSIHAAAAAQADQGVNPGDLRDLQTFIDVARGGILSDLIEHHHTQTARLKGVLDPMGMTCSDNPRVGHDQHDFRAQPARQFTDPLDAVQTEDQPRARLIIK